MVQLYKDYYGAHPQAHSIGANPMLQEMPLAPCSSSSTPHKTRQPVKPGQTTHPGASCAASARHLAPAHGRQPRSRGRLRGNLPANAAGQLAGGHPLIAIRFCSPTPPKARRGARLLEQSRPVSRAEPRGCAGVCETHRGRGVRQGGAGALSVSNELQVK